MIPQAPIFVTYTGDGTTVAFHFDKRIYLAADLQVWTYTPGVDTVPQLVALGYTVAVDNDFNGAVATFAVAPAVGVKVGLIRRMDLTQDINISNTNYVPPSVVEQQMDRQVMMAQEAALFSALGLDTDPFDFTAASRALSTLAFDASGKQTIGPTIAAVSAAQANATDAAASATAAAGSATASAASAAQAAATAATIAMPVPVALTFLQRNAGNTAYAALTPDNARLALTALKGQDIANFAGADENAKIAAMYASAPVQPYEYRADSHFGIIRDTAPLNYQGTRAALVVQHRDAAALGSNTVIPGVMFQFNFTGDGNVTPASDLSTSVWMGLTSSTIKSGDGSGQCFTAIGELHAVGAVGYNELGLFQGTGTNTGSTHGTISGVEMLIQDGSSGTHFDTAMHAVIGRIARFHNGAKDVANFFASSEGTVGPAAILSANPGGLHTWARGIDLKDAIFTVGQAILLPNNTSIASMNAAASASIPLMFLSGANELWLTAAATAGGITFANSALAVSFHVEGVASAVNYYEVSGAVAGQAPLHWALGSDTNIGAGYGTKGTGVHSFYTNGASFAKQFEIAHIATSVNYLQANGAVTTAAPLLAAQGSDANVGLGHATKGTGVHSFFTNGTAKQFEISHVAAAVNWVTVAGSAGTVVAISAGGSGTDIDLSLSGKGNGLPTFPVGQITASATAGVNGAAPAQVSGYMKMKLSGGTAIRVPYYNV